MKSWLGPFCTCPSPCTIPFGDAAANSGVDYWVKHRSIICLDLSNCTNQTKARTRESCELKAPLSFENFSDLKNSLMHMDLINFSQKKKLEG